MGAIAASSIVGLVATTPVLAADPASWQDYNGDGFADLAIGINGRTVNGHVSAGAVLVLYGSSHGLTAAHSQTWTQNSPGIGDSAAAGEDFGTGLASGDFDGDGFGDLAIGVPEEVVGGFHQAGIVHILYGSPHGLTATGSQILRDSSTGGDTDLSVERFGASLAALDSILPDIGAPAASGRRRDRGFSRSGCPALARRLARTGCIPAATMVSVATSWSAVARVWVRPSAVA